MVTPLRLAFVADELARREREPARAARREIRVVRDQQQRRAALAIQPEHQVGDLDAGRVVEIAGRLVGHQQLAARRRTRARSRRAAARRRRAASDSACVRRRRARRASSHSRARAAASRAPASSSGSITFSSAVSAGSSWNDWKTKPSQPLAQRRARVLVSPFESAMPSSQTSPVLGRSRPASSPEQRRLARARGADDRDRRAALDVEAHAVEDRERRVAALHGLGEIAGANDEISGVQMMPGSSLLGRGPVANE